MRIHAYFFLLIISALMALPLHGRGKGAVTQDKVKGSLIKLIREKNAIAAQRDKLQIENELLKSVSSLSWLLVNDSGNEVHLYHEGAMLIKASAKSTNERVVKTTTALKVGDSLKLKLSDSKSVKLKLAPGVTESYKMKNGESLSVTVDFLTGSRVWLLLVR